MEKLNIVIAEKDSFYLNQLANYILKSAQPFEVFTFSRQDSLERFLRQGEERIDILLLSEEMRCAAADGSSAGVKILLSESEQEAEGYGLVKKYQKTSSLLSEVMLLYGRSGGKKSRLLRGDRDTCFVGVWSPAGGSGKTTLALLLAHQLGLLRKKVFYLNYERVDSTRGLLRPEAGIGVSDLLVALQSREKGVGLSVLSKMCTPPKLGFSYVNPPESSLEFNEVALEEQLALLEELEGRFDFVVLDFESELNGEKLELLDQCDEILAPFAPDALGVEKLLRFFREAELRQELSAMAGKILYVANKLGSGGEEYLRQRGVYGKCHPKAKLPLCGELANLETALLNGYDASRLLAGVLERLCRDREEDRG